MSDIAIHGLGYVGLTAAVHWAKAGWRVFGYDPDVLTIEAMRYGKPRASEFLSYLNDDVAMLVSQGLIVPTSHIEDTLSVSVHSIAVPTEREGIPLDSIVRSVIRRLLVDTAEGTTILVESTLPPGTIDRVLEYPASDRLEAAVRPRYLAVCPRRDWFADASKNLETLPRVVGGVTPACTMRAKELLSIVSREILTTDYRTAELTKPLENALLHVPVMLATELAMNLPEQNVAEALKLACTHWRLMDIYLGMGTGGRCVPLGSQYLLGAAGPGGILEAAVTTDRHIRCAAAEAVKARGKQSALVLGIAYRPSFRDAGLSPGLAVAQHLRRSFGMEVRVHDPMWMVDELENLTGLPVITGSAEGWTVLPEGPEAVLLATAHPEYLTLPERVKWQPGVFVLDGPGAWSNYRELFLKAGVEYQQIGMAGWRGRRAWQ